MKPKTRPLKASRRGYRRRSDTTTNPNSGNPKTGNSAWKMKTSKTTNNDECRQRNALSSRDDDDFRTLASTSTRASKQGMLRNPDGARESSVFFAIKWKMVKRTFEIGTDTSGKTEDFVEMLACFLLLP